MVWNGADGVHLCGSCDHCNLRPRCPAPPIRYCVGRTWLGPPGGPVTRDANLLRAGVETINLSCAWSSVRPLCVKQLKRSFFLLSFLLFHFVCFIDFYFNSSLGLASGSWQTGDQLEAASNFSAPLLVINLSERVSPHTV